MKLNRFLELQAVPDGIFYYSLSVLLIGALIVIVYRYADKTSKLLDELVKNDAVQDTRLDHHDDEIQDLKKGVK